MGGRPVPPGVTFHSAAELSLEQLAAALTAVYADFYARMADLARAAGADPADTVPAAARKPPPVDFVSVAQYAETVRTQQVDLSRSVVARAPGGEVVGVAILGRRGDRGWLGDFGVVPAWRGRGLGDRLLAAFLERARRAGVRRVEFDVLEVNRPAIRVYERAGFAPVRKLVEWIAFGRDLGAGAGGAARPAEKVAPADEAALVAWFERRRHLDPPPCWERDLPALLLYPDARCYVLRRDGEERALVHAVFSGSRAGLMFVGLGGGEGPGAAREAAAALRPLLEAVAREGAALAGIEPGAVRLRVGLEPVGSRLAQALEAAGFRPGERSLSMAREL